MSANLVGQRRRGGLITTKWFPFDSAGLAILRCINAKQPDPSTAYFDGVAIKHLGLADDSFEFWFVGDGIFKFRRL